MHTRHVYTASIMMLCLALVLLVSACGGNTTADTPATPPADTQDDTSVTPGNEEDAQPATESEAQETEDADTTTRRDDADEAATEHDDATRTPPAAEDEDTPEREPAEDGRERNEPGGFAFRPIDGWDMQSLELFDGGATILMPANSDIDNPEAGINIFAGPIRSAQLFLGNVEEDGSIEEWFAVFAQDVEADGSASISEPQPVTIDGVDGLMADISSNEEDLGEMQGRVVIARVDSDRLFQMMGFATVEHWDAAQFDTVLESISFFEPVLPPTPAAPELNLDQLEPGGIDVITPSDRITPTEQLP